MPFSFVSVAGMIFTAVISIGVPVLAVLWLRHKTGFGLRAALVGGLCFVVSALVLEQILHAIVLPQILNIPWLYVIYGCLAAGVFEETGRLVGLKFLCKKNPRVITGAAYGIGHGGTEAILLAGMSSLANLSFALTYSANNTSVTVQQTAELMKNLPPYYFWISGVERISAMAMHFALSILIWMVVTKRLRFVWYFAAIGLHALTNLPAALTQVGAFTNVIAVEVLVFLAAAATCVLVGVLYFRTRGNAPQLPPEEAPAMDAPFVKQPAPVQPVLDAAAPQAKAAQQAAAAPQTAEAAPVAKAAAKADAVPAVALASQAAVPQPAGDAAEALEVPADEVSKA